MPVQPKLIPGRPWTIRTRLVAALLILSALALATVGTASVLLLHESLITRVDAQLTGTATTWTTNPLPLPITDPAKATVPTNFRIALLEPDGTVDRVLGTSPTTETGPALTTIGNAAEQLADQNPFTVPDTHGHSDWRVKIVRTPNHQLIAIALSLGDTDAAVQRLIWIEIIVGTVTLAALGFVATVVVRLGLRPLTRIEQTAAAITTGELERRVDHVDERTEAGRLGTALNTMLARLADALDEREQSRQRLQRFVADASHELRTPLTTIRGSAELYRSGGADDVARLMGRIEDEAGRMGQLVSDLLLLARLDEERPLDLTEVDLLVLVGDVVAAAQARQPDRPVALSAPHGPQRVLGDDHRLRQVITNLVGNALDHTPADTPVRVTVDREPNATNDCEPLAHTGPQPACRSVAVVEVTDHGTGVPAAQAPRLFDRFYRISRKPTGNGGSGLGLAIAAAIVEAHGGRIELFSPPGGGARFRVLLPLG